MENLKFLQLVAYIFCTYLYLRSKQASSNLTELHRAWIKRLMYGLGLYAIFDFCHFLGIYHFQYDYIFDIARLILVSGAFMVYYMGYATLRQPEIIAGDLRIAVSDPPSSNPRYEKSALNAEKSNQLVEQLLQQMESKKLWLNKELRLSDLAQSLDISKHHLSQLLNESLEQNFYDFVNAYRVKAAQQMLHDPAFEHYTILAIAYEAGFKNKASFNTAFKKHSGTTPSTYRKHRKPSPGL